MVHGQDFSTHDWPQPSSFAPEHFQYAPLPQRIQMQHVSRLRRSGMPPQRHLHGRRLGCQVGDVLIGQPVRTHTFTVRHVHP